MIRVIHYLNQFFGGLGGEEAANAPLVLLDGARGPAKALHQLDPEIHVTATLVGGDNHMAEHLEAAVDEAVALVARQHEAEPLDLLIAGPAFNSGRYGMACAAVCEAVERRLGIPTLTALYPDNPAVPVYRNRVAILKAADDVMGMSAALEAIARAVRKLASGQRLDPEDGLLPRGMRENYFASQTGAERAVEMLFAKLKGEPFVTEYAMPEFDRVAPAAPIESAARATIALITSGGIVPKGNPDRIPSASASRYGAYDITGLERLSAATHQSVHGGYDPTYANADPNRVLPLDAARILEREGRIGRLFQTYFATVGNATSVATARRFGTEIAPLLVNEGVQAVVLTST